MKKVLYLAVGISMSALLTASSCKKKCDDCNQPPKVEKGPLEMQLVHKIDGAAFESQPKTFTNEEGEVYSIQAFKYYLGNFSLVSSTGAEFQLSGPQYYLINAQDASTLSMKFDSLPNGDYTQLKFTLGVDSVSNSTSAHDGALDPANNMAWNWATGYVFMRWTGEYQPAVGAKETFALDMGLNSNLVNYALPTNFKIEGATKKIELEFDLAEILKGPYSYGFKKDTDNLHTSISDQQNFGNKLAVNMRDAFKVVVK